MTTQYEVEESLSKAIQQVNSIMYDIAIITKNNEQIADKVVAHYKSDPWREQHTNILQHAETINANITNCRKACEDLEETLTNLKDRFKELEEDEELD